MDSIPYSPSGVKQDNDLGKAATVLKDASYVVEYKPEGVFLSVSYEEGAGLALLPDCVVFDLERRGIAGLKTVDMILRIRKGENYIKLSDPQDEKTADMNFIIRFGKEDMSATMMLFPPAADGACKDEQTVLSEIRQKWNATHGIDEQAVADAVQGKRYYKEISIAQGKSPEKGKDGFLTFMFQTVHTYTPKMLSDGSADYKNLDLFETVHENDVLVVNVPPEDGTAGYTVKGKVLPAAKGKEALLPKGKNVAISDDGKSLVALKSGRVDYINGKVEISDMYKISGDVDMSIGNIDFIGDLIIYGNINSGFILKTTGNIEVHGFVDASTLISGKDIILKNGFQGNDRGNLKAEGNIVARFIERGKVEAKRSVFADYIVHSMVTAGETVVMKGKHGKIIGGLVRAGKEIAAISAGSASGENTSLEVGISPELRMRLADLESKRIQLKAQLDKMDNIARVLPSAHVESEERLAMRQKLLEARKQLAENYNNMINEIEEIKLRLTKLSDGRIHIFSKAYPDVKIMVDSCFYTIKTLMEYVTFKNKEGEVVFSSCEIKN